VASEIHNFLTSAGRRGTPASQVDAAQCVGCDTCMTMCPFGAIALVDRPEEAPRPAEVREDGKLAVIDPDTCRACGICAANCPEVAIAHNLSDDALFGRIAMMTHGVEEPIVGFYCKECAGAAIGLSGQHRDRYPESVRLIELPCLGRVSALHIVEAARMQIAGEVLSESGTPLPLELWNLCAVDRLSVGRRIRMFCAKAVGDEISATLVEHEMELIGAGALAGAPAGTACGGGEVCGCDR
jgi:ferredoxin